MKEVKVLVSSCACNQKYLALVEKVVKENGIDAKVSAVSDIMEQMQYNVMSLPALVVDGQVAARGQKSEKELIQILKLLLSAKTSSLACTCMHAHASLEK